jgi:hypothetical protein
MLVRTMSISLCAIALTLATGAFARNGPGLVGNFAILGPDSSLGAENNADSGLVVGRMGYLAFDCRMNV